MYEVVAREHRFRRVLRKWGVASVVLGLMSPVNGATLVLEPQRDVTIFSESSHSSGADNNIFAGTTNQGNRRRALVYFDISSHLPANAEVLSAQLTMFVTNSNDDKNDPMTLHRLHAAWGEGTSNGGGPGGQGSPPTPQSATWLYRSFPADTWGTPGGDFDPQASASAVVGGNNRRYTWSSGTLASDVQAFLDQPTLDFGWILLGHETETGSARRIGSREMPEAQYRPKLIIDFLLTATCDLNHDASVDAADANLQFANWGMSGLGDCNEDGIVDAADASLLFAEWTGDIDAASISVLPEPRPVSLLHGLCVAPALARVRRKGWG